MAALLAAAATVALALAPSARGANVIVGSPLTASFTSGTINDTATLVQASLPGPATAASPVSGTVVRWNTLGFTGGPFRIRVIRPLPGGLYLGAGTSAPGTPGANGVGSFETSLPIQAGDLIGINNSNPSDMAGSAPTTGATYGFWLPPLADGSTRPLSGGPVADTEFGFNAEVRPVSNDISFGKLTKNKNKGTAKLVVTVPDPGSLALFGKGLKRFTATAAAPGDVTLRIKAKGKAKRKLNEDGKRKVRAKVKFTPTGIAPGTESRKVTLRKKD